MKNFIKLLKSVLFCTLIVVYICGCGKGTAEYMHSEEKGTSEVTEEIPSEEDSKGLESEVEEVKLLYVYVCGAIQYPGVYTLPEGSRICDLFEMAGGFTEDAATEYWNQARLLVDGEMLYVPTIEEAEKRQEEGIKVSAGSAELKDINNTNGKTNLNTASLEELMNLPGIGEAKAKSILNYRQENGGFASIEELMNIEGIKEGVFSRIKEYIVVN